MSDSDAARAALQRLRRMISPPPRPFSPPRPPPGPPPPPLPLGPGDDPALADAVLREMGGEAAPFVWRALGDLRRWAAAPPRARARLFAPGTGAERMDALRKTLIPHELWVPLAVLAELAARPADVDHARLRHACRRLAGYAERVGAFSTALAVEAYAARAWPGAFSLLGGREGGGEEEATPPPPRRPGSCG